MAKTQSPPQDNHMYCRKGIEIELKHGLTHENWWECGEKVCSQGRCKCGLRTVAAALCQSPLARHGWQGSVMEREPLPADDLAWGGWQRL
jgi:hypothetical protein